MERTPTKIVSFLSQVPSVQRQTYEENHRIAVLMMQALSKAIAQKNSPRVVLGKLKQLKLR